MYSQSQKIGKTNIIQVYGRKENKGLDNDNQNSAERDSNTLVYLYISMHDAFLE